MLSIQTASLYASGQYSQFAGSGGPWAYDPYTGQFGGVVSSAALQIEPFNDQLYGVGGGGEVVFVIAVQNLGSQDPAYDVLLRDTMPPGFSALSGDAGVTVTDGAGNVLAFSGDLFDPAGGLQLADPLGLYDPDSGQNVALITFTLQASDRFPAPLSRVTSGAQLVSYATEPQGQPIAVGLQATTPLTSQTLGIATYAAATQLAVGEQASIDVILALPEGEVMDLRLAEIFPQGAGLRLVSASLAFVGDRLVLAAPQVQPDGSISFGTVFDQPDGVADAQDLIDVQLVVEALSGSGGTGRMQAVVSAADPNTQGATWSDAAAATFTITQGSADPTIEGAPSGQSVQPQAQIQPFSGLVLTDPDPSRTHTLTIQLGDVALGGFVLPAGGTYDAGTGTFAAQGNLADVQGAARALVFAAAAGQNGPEIFTITLNDGAGGVAVVTGAVVVETPNTAPSITGAIAGQSVSGRTVVQPFAAISFADPDPGQTQTLTIQLANRNLGQLNDPAYNPATGTFRVVGSVAAVQAAARALTFTPAGPAGEADFIVTLNDGAGGVATDMTTTLAITAPNTVPVITGAQSGQIVIGSAQSHPFASLTLTDPDQGQTETLTVRLQNLGLGMLTGAPLGAYDSQTGQFTMQGTVAELQQAVRALGYSPGAGQFATEWFAITLNDAAGGIAAENAVSVQHVPDTAPTIKGARGAQNATSTMLVHPFAGLVLTDPDPGQIQTLRVQPSVPGLGGFTNADPSAYDPDTGIFQIHGTVDQVQAAARNLIFAATSNQTGSETYTVSLDDGAGGAATNTGTVVRVATASPAAAQIQRFAPSPSATILTQTAGGDETEAQVETYAGPVDYLQSQFIYDGSEALAIVATSPNIFVKSVAGSAAVQLQSGRNVVDAGHGSNFLLGGTGSDVFFLDGRQNEEVWDTIVGFHTGDIATLWGYKDGVSGFTWDEVAGATGFTGRTLRADLTGSGHFNASLTFAGNTAADTAHYAITTGNIQGNDYMAIFAL